MAVCCLQPLPLRGFDEECRNFIAEQYEVSGLNIHSQSTPTRIEKKEDSSLTLHVKKKDGQEEAIEGLETILMATGRSPNTQNMNLDKVGHTILPTAPESLLARSNAGSDQQFVCRYASVQSLRCSVLSVYSCQYRLVFQQKVYTQN